MRALVSVASLIISGCNAPSVNQNNGSATNLSLTNVAVPAPQPNVAASPLVGRWGDNGDCSRPIELFANGTYRAGDGTRGHWTLDGQQLTLVAGARRVVVQLVSVTQDRVVILNANGQRGESVRCA